VAHPKHQQLASELEPSEPVKTVKMSAQLISGRELAGDQTSSEDAPERVDG
jgi:hypothetical protein